MKKWKRGRSTQVFPAKDGHVRVVEIKTAGGLRRRHVFRRASLVIDGECQEDSRRGEC